MERLTNLFLPNASLFLNIVEQAKDIQEEIDEVQVKADSAHDVLVGRKSCVDEVRVVDYIAAEEQSTSSCDQKIESAVEWKEYPDETGHHESDDASEEPRSKTGEVILGLQGEQGQTQEDAKGDQQSLKDYVGFVEWYDDAESEGFHQSKSR